MLLTRVITLLLCLSLALPPCAGTALAEGRTYSIQEELIGSPKGNEFVSGNYPGAVLMPVNIWGAVMKTGIHHVPTGTDLISLFSFAGGPLKDAELEDVTVRRKTRDGEQIIQVNMRKLLTQPGHSSPVLEPNDIVLIATKDEGISANTMKTITVVSAILGVIVSSIVVSDKFKSK